MEFEERYNRLNPSQKEAVDSIEGPVMVVAGPGTGKTTILTLRIANILKKTDTPAHGILALTFTEAGVKAMRLKLKEVIGDRAYDVKIHTFHSFASWAISTYGEHFVHLKDREQMADLDAEDFIRSILENEKYKDLRPMGNPDYYIYPILKAISDSKKDAITPSMVRDFAEEEIKRIENDESSISTRGATKGELKAEAKKKIEKCKKTIVFSYVYSDYEEKKALEKKMDYDDLLIEILLVMRKDELFLRILQEQFLYILVDEHQDTNDSQNMIIEKLAEFFDNPNIFIVGDEKQAIYRFQGASVENFLKLQKNYSEMKVIHLEDNYRSHQGILDASFSMIGKNYDDNSQDIFRKELKSGTNISEKPIDIILSQGQEQMEDYLVNSLKKIVEDEEGAEIAVITRTNKDRDRIYSIINERGLSAFSEKTIDVFSHPFGILYIDLLKSVLDSGNLEDLAKTIACGMWNLSFDESALLLRNIRSGMISEISRKIPKIHHLMSMMTSGGTIDFLIRLGEDSGYIKHILKSPQGSEIWRAIVSLGEYALSEVGSDDTRAVIERILLHSNSKKKITIKISVGREDAPIKVMTSHRSKGLEFDYVFIPYGTEESWFKRSHSSNFVLPNVGKDDENEKDTRRLFYVALTRAKKHAVILLSEEDVSGRVLLPLRFISEIEESKILKIHLPEEEAEIKKSSDTATIVSRDRMEYAKRVLRDKGLSVTALNHFIKCPSEFFFLSVLKLPQAPNINSEKGSAMHLALSRVWEKRPENIEATESIIKSSIEEFLSKSFLPSADKERIREKLMEDAPAVSRELFGHFSTIGQVYTETWVEGVFKAKEGDIPIHGKLDVVIDDGKQVLVFDYKTKKGMSENAIKGETKSDDGSYFRQLIFYRLLVEKDKRFGGKDILPALVFVSPDDKGKCPIVTIPIEEKDIIDIKTKIENLVESVWSGEFLKQSCEDNDCVWCKLKQTFQT